MKNLFAIFLLFLSLSNSACGLDRPLKIHLFTEVGGKGLEKDKNILLDALNCLNCDVEWFETNSQHITSLADINIFIQNINRSLLHTAERNWFIPNPEWFMDGLDVLDSIDLILCRTKEVERIFKELNQTTYFLGFTSEDRYREDVRKKSSSYLHVAGTSALKGSAVVSHVWFSRADFPELTYVKRGTKLNSKKNVKVVKNHLSEKKHLKLQNKSLVHLCLSETEGFGHYLLEAMSTASVVVTTDAPPMNEFVQDVRCLVPFNRTAPQNLAKKYYADADAFEHTIEALRQLPQAELERIGRQNRARYLQLKHEFHENLRVLIESVL